MSNNATNQTPTPAKPTLDIGTTYLSTSGIAVTPIRALPGNRALFVCSEFPFTPFVVWEYYLTDNANGIEVCRGLYYRTLEDAFEAEDLKPRSKLLKVLFYCPDCEKKHRHIFCLDNTVQELVEQIEDARVTCDDCGYMFMGIHSITICDSCEYELPLWHGPVTEDGITTLSE